MRIEPKTRKNEAFLFRYKAIIFAIFLAASTFGIYSRVITYDFINFDDDIYVTNNTVVQEGFTSESLAYAFTLTGHKSAYWHPSTWLSHMLDCQLFGLNASMHHLTSILLHIANSLLLFFVLHSMTGAFLQSALVATLFAIHPLSVDSVAWVAERKNVLSTFFWMLTMSVYITYARKPGKRRYLAVCGLITLGLLAKPILATLPFVLLIMDFWPMNRTRTLSAPNGIQSFPKTSVLKLVFEKAPFLALSLAVMLLSSYTLKNIGVYISTAQRSMSLRIENALVSYVKYIGKTLWPDNLAVYYPFPASIPMWQVFSSAALLVAVSVLVITQLRSRPWFAVGWFWFLGTLFPVIGLVQGGLFPEMADRWAYIPQIGIFIMVAWPAATLAGTHTFPGKITFCLVGIVLIALGIAAWNQTRYWKNSKTLFTHAQSVTGPNAIVHRNLGQDLLAQKDYDGAIAHFRKSIGLNPFRAEVHTNLGIVLLAINDSKGAMQQFLEVIKQKPQDPKAYIRVGLILKDADNAPQAIEYFEKALAIEPDDVIARYNLGYCLAESGNFEKGENEVLKTLPLNSDKVEGLYNVGAFYGKFNRQEQARSYLEKVLKYHPDHPNANYNLGIIAAGQNKDQVAEKYFLTTLANSPAHVDALNNLGLLYSKNGRFNEAVQQFEKALEIAPDDNLVRFNLADTLLQTGKFTAASKQFARITKIDPDHEGARIGYHEASQYIAALDSKIERTEKLLSLDPESPVLLVAMGNLYSNRGDTERGLEYYRKAETLYPDHPGVLNKIAAALSRAGSYAEAISYFKRVIDIAPEKPAGYYNVACMYSRLNEIAHTDRWLKMALARGYDKWRNIETDTDLINFRKTDVYAQLLKAKQ